MKINVKIKKILFRKEKEKGNFFWCIIRTDVCTATGELSWDPREGESLELTGEYKAYRGENQFVFKAAVMNVPENPYEKLKYACEITLGFGDAACKKIWDELGDGWEGMGSGSVKGISGEKYRLFLLTIEEMGVHVEKTKAVTFLLEKGCTIKMSEKAYNVFEKNTISILSANCYRLTELKNVGFCHIDNEIRQRFGVEDNDKCRIKAGLLYSIKMLMADGSSFVFKNQLLMQALQTLQLLQDRILDILDAMVKSNELKELENMTVIALIKEYEYEKLIWEFAKL